VFAMVGLLSQAEKGGLKNSRSFHNAFPNIDVEMDFADPLLDHREEVF